MKKTSIILAGLLLSLVSLAQDIRTLETKVADLLARMPVYNQNDLDRQMTQMPELGYEGLTDICNRIVSPGGGDDTRARFAVEAYSRYLSAYGYVNEQNSWEDICIEYVKKPADYNVKSFFMRQLQTVGGKASTELAATFLGDRLFCEPAVAVIAACKTPGADKILVESLKNPDLPCAASIMNTLAGWKSDGALNSYISWYSRGNLGEKAAALNALAMSGSSGALKTLANAAGDAGYGWDATGATAAYLEYAVQVGDRGDVKTLEKICREVMTKADFESGLQYKTAALEIRVLYREYESIDLLLEALRSENIEYRHAALQFADYIKGRVATGKFITLIGEVPPVMGAEIIKMLGDRGDLSAVTSLKRCLFSASQVIRVASVGAITRLCEKDAIDDVIDYMRSYPDWVEQKAGIEALVEISDSKRRDKIAQAMEGSADITKINFLLVLAGGGENKYFPMALKYTGSDLYELRSMAFSSLGKLASSENQEELLDLLEKVEDQAEIEKVQLALAVAANQVEDKPMRAEKLLIALGITKDKSKIIPVLPEVGGKEALRTVIKVFNEGAPGMRDICFDALTNWKDHSASYALYDICRSGNKSYSTKAFNGYLRQVINTPDGDQKLLLLRKIMHFALTEDQKASVISSISGVKSVQALIYISGFLEDKELQQVAARSAMKIALPGTGSESGLYGDNVKNILLKIIEILDGEESDYYKERIKTYLSEMPDDPGFVSMFNGKDLDGWQGLVENPVARSKMSSKELAAKQSEADKKMYENWSVKDGAIWFSGKGANLCSVKDYADFVMLVDWRITKKGDSGIYLRGTPQVQIWDTSRVESGAQVGSGGLYNNQSHESKPSKVMDNPVGDWNTFRIFMTGEKVSVWLNGELIVDNVTMENYWDRSIPIFPEGAIELQAHGNELAFRDIYVREIEMDEYNLTPDERADGFIALFNGRDLDRWLGNRGAYVVDDGMIVVNPDEGSGGNLYTEKEYTDFIFRFEFKLTPGANNGLGIRAPLKGDAAYVGMELQILDNTAEIYANLQPYQYHGSVYGVIPAKRGFLKPVGEWNEEEVIIRGTQIKITLNGNVIVDGDIADARDNGTMDHRDHPGLKRDKGHIGFLGHGSVVNFRNIRIKELSK